MRKFSCVFPLLLLFWLTVTAKSLNKTFQEAKAGVEKEFAELKREYKSIWEWRPVYPTDISTIMQSIISAVSAFIMMVGGAAPYIPQYRAIQKNQNAEGFSTYVCLTLLIANILRITFWFGKPFELPLLAQSFIMIGTMLLVLRLVINVRQRTGVNKQRKHFREMDPNSFWQWTDFQSYVEFLACFASLCAFLMFLLRDSSMFVETVGFLSVFTEACLGLPQFYRNFRNKSTAGMSLAMVLMWTSGDLFKTVYFILRDAPVQFSICGALQICIDIAILLQVYSYGSSGGRNVSFQELPKR